MLSKGRSRLWLKKIIESDRNTLMFKVQSCFVNLCREFLTERDFTEIHSPKLIGAESESGAGVFKVDYFDRNAYLAQSPQFYKQMAIASGFEKVFEIGAQYRAEKSFTNKHATEFTGFDLEFSYINSHLDVMKMEEEMLTYALAGLKEMLVIILSPLKLAFNIVSSLWKNAVKPLFLVLTKILGAFLKLGNALKPITTKLKEFLYQSSFLDNVLQIMSATIIVIVEWLANLVAGVASLIVELSKSGVVTSFLETLRSIGQVICDVILLGLVGLFKVIQTIFSYLNLENLEDVSVFAFVCPKDKAKVRKALKDDLKYVEEYAKHGYIGTVAGINLYTKQDATEGEIIVATRDAVTIFNKKGVEIEQITTGNRSEESANKRINTTFSRKYYVVALTNESKAVKIKLGA